jgi:hypothetical protein
MSNELFAKVEFYSNIAITYALGVVSFADEVDTWIKIIASVCAILTTIFGIRKYYDGRELQRKRIMSEQMEQDAQAQKYLYYLNRNKEFTSNQKEIEDKTKEV